MDLIVAVLKYAFVVALGVEIALVLRALARLAVEKARPAPPEPEEQG
jgi:hypothetical protein